MTSTLPDRFCTVIISAASVPPSCGHVDCAGTHNASRIVRAFKMWNMLRASAMPEDKITLTFDTRIISSLSPSRAVSELLNPVSVSL